MSAPRRIGRVVLQLPLLVWTLLALVPFALILLLSLRNNTDIYAHPLGVGGHYDLGNYSTAWNGAPDSAGMSTLMLNTLIAAFAAVMVSLLVGSLAAYFATTLQPRARQWFLRAFVVGSIVPFVLLMIPLYQLYNSAGLINSPLSVGVMYGVLQLPTTVLILHSFYSDFPIDLVEAASLDGLGPFGVFFRIVLPLSKAALTATGIIVLIYSWGEAQLGIVMLQDPLSQTVTVGLLGFQGEFSQQLGPIFAGLTIATFPVIVLYLIFNRNVAKGLALGGVFR